MNGLAKRYVGRVNAEIIPVNAPGAAERLERYGFIRFGMLLADAKDEVLWQKEGHKMTESEIHSQIDDALSER